MCLLVNNKQICHESVRSGTAVWAAFLDRAADAGVTDCQILRIVLFNALQCLATEFSHFLLIFSNPPISFKSSAKSVWDRRGPFYHFLPVCNSVASFPTLTFSFCRSPSFIGPTVPESLPNKGNQFHSLIPKTMLSVWNPGDLQWIS